MRLSNALPRAAIALRLRALYDGDIASGTRVVERARAVSKKKRRQPAVPAGPSETQASIVVTVAWTMTVMTTLVCAAAAAILWLVARERVNNRDLMLLVYLLHFSAIVTACVSLALLPVMLKVRRVPPPPSLIVVAVGIAALPILAALL